MLLSVQRPRLLGNALAVPKRGRSCGVQAVNDPSKYLVNHFAQLSGLELDENKLNRLLEARGPHSIVKVLLTDFPELHEPMKQLVKAGLDIPIFIHYKGDSAKKHMVPRLQLLRASSSCAAVEEFLKQQLGITSQTSQQRYKVTFSRGGSPGEAAEYELTDQVLEQYPMAFIVGFANDWFISDM